MTKREKDAIIAGALVTATTIATIIGGVRSLSNNKTKNKNEAVTSRPITPADIKGTHEEEIAIFQKTKTEYSELRKFIFYDLNGICLYSLDQKIFLLTQDSDDVAVICYADCATEKESNPVAMTKDRSILILETEEGKKIAVRMRPSEEEETIDSEDYNSMEYEELDKKYKNSLFELVEELIFF